MRLPLQFACLVVGAALAHTALAKEHLTEETMEATADMLVLPAVTEGVLTVRTCEKCPARTLHASAATRYMLGRKIVTLKDLSDYVRSNGRAFTAVSYDRKTLALNGIKVSVGDTSR